MVAAAALLSSALALAVLVSPPVVWSGPPDALADADALYARRDEGAHLGRALPGPIDQAIDVYFRALEASPDSAEVRWKLLRALFFRATFCGSGAPERQRILDRARRIADDGVARLEASEALRRAPGAAALYYWAAVAWGEWALATSRFTAARQGAAGRIRDLAQRVIDLDPELEEGGGYRILGRLHDQSPRIPFLTGWVSRKLALENLRNALEAGPDNTVNQFFLADAILAHDPSHQAEARALLARCAAAVPRPQYRVEDAYYAALARGRLAELR